MPKSRALKNKERAKQPKVKGMPPAPSKKGAMSNGKACGKKGK